MVTHGSASLLQGEATAGIIGLEARGRHTLDAQEALWQAGPSSRPTGGGGRKGPHAAFQPQPIPGLTDNSQPNSVLYAHFFYLGDETLIGRQQS